jgi:muramoyltetrapeptide carboxypeptidase LdcA involved in peptidoglycan recycling
MDGVTPPPVEPGDKVAVIAPSSQRPEPIVERGVERLQTSFDVDPVVYPSATADDQLSPGERAEEFHEVFESDVTAAFAVTGGEDQLRLLRHLDIEHLQKFPTRFFGISDNTILHLALSAAGLVSYYGGQFVPGIALDPTLPEYTERFLRRALFEQSLGAVEPAPKWTDDRYDFSQGTPRDWETNPGWTWDFPTDETVTGPMWGGCMVILEHFLAVDQFVPEPDEEFVLVLETSELIPEPYTVKSVLRCLGERNLLEKTAAVVVGRPKTRHKEPRSKQKRRQYRKEQRKAIRQICRTYRPNVPILFDFDFGHTDPHMPIPIGGQVTLNPSDKSIVFGTDI